MTGKKFVILFLIGTLFVGFVFSFYIKKTFDNRPKINIDENK